MKPVELLRLLMELEKTNPNDLSKQVQNRTKQPQIQRFLSGATKSPRASTLMPLAKHFRIPIAAFFDEQAAAAAWQDVQRRQPNPSAKTSKNDSPPAAGERLPTLALIGAVAHTIAPSLSWGDVVSGSVLPVRFELAVPDDALAPTTGRGTVLLFDVSVAPSPGAGVLVEARDGRRYVRMFAEGVGSAWVAKARNDAYVSLRSEEDGLKVLATVVARFGCSV